MILLRAEGIPPAQVARLDPRPIHAYVRRFNQDGPASLVDARSHTTGRPPLLNPEQLQSLETALKSEPEQWGRWSGPKVRCWMETCLGLEPETLHDARGWEALKALNYSYKSSRPRHVNSADDETRELTQHSLYLFEHPEEVQGRTLFHLWPETPLFGSN